MAPKDVRQNSVWHVKWSWAYGPEAARDAEVVRECSELFSCHYGIWGPMGPRPGSRVRMSSEGVAKLLDTPDTWLASAHVEDRLVGYCITLDFEVPGKGRVHWTTQLVVDEAYRNARIGTTLLYSVWQFSDCYAWGLATANPLAVRALETATRRPCRQPQVRAEGAELLRVLSDRVEYLPQTLAASSDGGTRPAVQTGFFISRKDMSGLRERAARRSRPWSLGDLLEGEEWLACTFGEQPPFPMDGSAINELLSGADTIWMQAYERMTLDDSHAWHRHAAEEVSLVLNLTSLSEGRVLDVGCGDGRHVREFNGRGFDAVGLDVVARPSGGGAGAELLVGDARESLPVGPFDLVVALYDVLGSSGVADDDRRILKNARRSLAPQGWLVLSVMNMEPSLGSLPPSRLPADHDEFVRALEALPPSGNMQTTGDVFDPERLLFYGGVFYRKEQFGGAGSRLPAEMVVRDRRFTAEVIRDVVERAGFVVVDVIPVQSGRWGRRDRLSQQDLRAKELLVVARVAPPSA